MTATVIPPPVKAPRCAAASMPSARPLMTTTPARASSSPSCSATASPYGDGRREPTIATRGPSGGGQRPFVLSAGRLSGGDIVQPETERFEDVALLDLCRAVHVRGRPCDAPGAMESPRGQAALRGPAFEASASSLAQRSEAAQRARFELRVEHRLALVLPPSRRDHSLAHPRRLLAARLARERLEGDAADGNLEVDPVEERRGQASPIGVDGGRRAAAGPDRIPAPAARARVRGRDEAEARGVGDGPGRPRDRPPTRLERLAQGLQHRGLELRKLVEEQDAVVRPADLSRHGEATPAAHQPGGRDAVVRGPERPLPLERTAAAQVAEHA